MKIDFPYNDDLLRLNSIFNKDGADNLRIVGGAIRNFLLKKEIVDFDLSCVFPPEEIVKILRDNNIKFKLVGVSFGTVMAIVNNKSYEITSTREDIQTNGRHAVVKYTADFKIDASRRDFTFNALYLDFNNNLYDYFGGLEDLKKGIVRFIGSAEARIKEDYLRILRFFRFFCYYGTVLDNEGLKFSTIYKDELKKLSSERIKSEMFKILLADYPIQVLKIMEDNGILNLITGLNKFNFNKLEILYSLKKFLNVGIDSTLALALLLKNADEVNIIKDKWKLSNKESDVILYLLKHGKDKSYDVNNIKRLVFLEKNKDYIGDLIIFNGVINNENIDNINNYLEILRTLKLPKLPINGIDLEENGFLDKNKYTELLDEAKEMFVKSDFSLTKKEIISKLKLLTYGNNTL